MNNWKILILIAVIFTGCKKAYNPPAISSDNSYLVVEGVINSGGDSTIIKLSRTVKLSATIAINPEQNAQLVVQSDQNVSYYLTETTKGYYVSSGLNLNSNSKYRLIIKTQNGEQYVSDYVPVLNSPPIDSVTYTVQNNGVSILVNTHDPNNKTRYYRWDYNETWRFHSDFDSYFKSNGDTVLFRDFATDQIYTCWHTDTSSSIILNNSARLVNDIISSSPVGFIPSTSEKIVNEYCITLKQYALTSEAYSFWQNLQKNTEQLGSIFDAQPSQLSGNIHCTNNPALQVIGYVSVGTFSSQRKFIFNRNLPAWLPPKTNDSCYEQACLYQFYAKGADIPQNQVDQFINYNKGAINPLIPTRVIQPPGAPKPIGYFASTPLCVDCSLRGSRIQPSYWRYQ